MGAKRREQKRGDAGRRDRRTLRDLVPSDLLVQRLYCTTKKDAIAELLNGVAIHGVIDISREQETLDAILEREQVASTAIGGGLAMPHAKTKHADRFGVAVGLSEDGIDFAALDGVPVRAVFLWVCQPGHTKEHLSLMRALAATAHDPDSVARIANCRDRKQVLSVLGEIEVADKGK